MDEDMQQIWERKMREAIWIFIVVVLFTFTALAIKAQYHAIIGGVDNGLH